MTPATGNISVADIFQSSLVFEDRHELCTSVLSPAGTHWVYPICLAGWLPFC